MKALLISPKGSNFYAKVGNQLPPLGLAYIAGVIREKGHQVRIIDLGIEPRGLSNETIQWPDVVAISTFTPSYPEALSVAKIAKEAGKLVIMGGYHVSFLDKEALETGLVDYVVRGEGEYTFLNLLNCLETNGNLLAVAGISFLHMGVYQKNKDSPPPSNLNDMPLPARDLLPMKKYNTVMNGWQFTNLITSRGCPYNCYFCSSSSFGGLKWRSRSAKSIVDEIEHLSTKYGYTAFSFMDDNFTLVPKRVFEFADELERRGLNNIRWWCFSRVDILIKNEPMVKRMAESGAYMVFLGLESNNTTILESYHKHIENDQQEQAIKLLAKYGIEIHASYILGDIHETSTMAENTIKWAKKVNAKSSQFSILTPYPGTALFDDVQTQNRFLHKKWEIFDGLHPVIQLDYLIPKHLSQLLVKAYKKIYLNPSFIFSLIFKKGNKLNPPSRTFSQKIMNVVKTIEVIGFLIFKLKKFSSPMVNK